MDVLTQLIYLLRQLTDLIWSLHHLIALLQDLLRSLTRIRWTIPTQQQKQRRRRGRYSKSYLTDPKNRELQDKLKGMLHYDIPTAKRLLKQQRQLHPGQSDNWYLEKVIHDLERDRH